MRGYFGIGIENTKTKANIGTLWRSAYGLGAAFIFVIGNRYKKQASDTVKAMRHIPMYHYDTFEQFYENMPKDCQLIGIELCKSMKKLTYKGKPVKVVKDRGRPCDNCIFFTECARKTNFKEAQEWERENKLTVCMDKMVKYLYA
ncbi:hypothetical protein LCGC14_1312390 [marine sediment metagenome]|uniref:tRNA/rRNA methyltransferase SpoU type domain-containing protein n=1 Tax=marine sediment metagenome TaxID=412755 RepID=A0A0F9L704_9ZZZZ|nr:hypothetical protein [bacterium]